MGFLPKNVVMATATYVQKGENIDYTATAAVAYMEVVPLAACVGVALEPIEKGNTGTLTLTGVYDLPAATSLAIDVGDKVYWNAKNNNIDKTDTGIPAGIAVAAKTEAGTVARVKIG